MLLVQKKIVIAEVFLPCLTNWGDFYHFSQWSICYRNVNVSTLIFFSYFCKCSWRVTPSTTHWLTSWLVVFNYLISNRKYQSNFIFTEINIEFMFFSTFFHVYPDRWGLTLCDPQIDWVFSACYYIKNFKKC